MVKTKLTDEFAVVVVIAFLMLSGAALGWAARCITMNDKYLVAAYQKSVAERDYFNGQYLQLVSDNKGKK